LSVLKEGEELIQGGRWTGGGDVMFEKNAI
jgi:hypothetical protein